jgi:hypothetical protein
MRTRISRLLALLMNQPVPEPDPEPEPVA